MIVILVAALGGCNYFDSTEKRAARLTGGNPKIGRDKILYYGCESCHTIPGVRGAKGMVGPPLDHIASRTYIAGELPNTPQNMMYWIRKPREVEQHTAMPDMNVSENDSRDIVAYLYTLR
jgi:cytochrome c